jgi:hypothetical protein
MIGTDEVVFNGGGSSGTKAMGRRSARCGPLIGQRSRVATRPVPTGGAAGDCRATGLAHPAMATMAAQRFRLRHGRFDAGSCATRWRIDGVR